MAASDRHNDDILTRLTSLETSSRRLYEEILPLQRENVTLIRENVVLKKEIDNLREDFSKLRKESEEEKNIKKKEIDNLREDLVQMKKTIEKEKREKQKENGTLRDDFSKLKKDTQKEKYLKQEDIDTMSEDLLRIKKKVDMEKSIKQKEIDTLHEDLSKMKKDNEEEKYLSQKNINSIDKKLSSLENDMKAAHRKHDENHKTMTKKMKTFTSKTETSEQRIEERMSQLFQIRTVLNRAMVECHKDGGVEERVTDLLERVKSLEEKSDQLSTSLISVSIDTSTLGLATRKYMKLDKCYQEYVNLGGFNTTSCFLQPKTTGQYVVFVRFRQSRDGCISVYLRGNHNTSEYMGKTVRTDDMVTGVAVVTIESIPSNLWVEAIRDEGNAVIFWCRLTSWKLCDV